MAGPSKGVLIRDGAIFMVKLWIDGLKDIVLTALAVGALVFAGANPPPVLPTAPIVDFRLPVFNEQGFRVWELRGSEAIYDHAAQRAEIKGLRLRVFSGDDRELLENTVESPLAIVKVAERSITGPGMIHLVGAERRVATPGRRGRVGIAGQDADHAEGRGFCDRLRT